MIKTTAIILAAGKSKRAKTDKQFYKLSNRYLIEHTIEKFISLNEITEIILVLSNKNLKKFSSLFTHPKIKLTAGGETRMDSLLNGSKELNSQPDVVLVHDGARPFVTEQLIKKIIKNSKNHGCAIPIIPLKDTIKEIDTENLTVKKTLPRENIFAVQTPQGYRFDIFKKILSKAKKHRHLTDDSQIPEKLKIPIKVILGEEANIKITTPLDLKIAEVIYENSKKEN